VLARKIGEETRDTIGWSYTKQELTIRSFWQLFEEILRLFCEWEILQISLQVCGVQKSSDAEKRLNDEQNYENRGRVPPK